MGHYAQSRVSQSSAILRRRHRRVSMNLKARHPHPATIAPPRDNTQDPPSCRMTHAHKYDRLSHAAQRALHRPLSERYPDAHRASAMAGHLCPLGYQTHSGDRVRPHGSQPSCPIDSSAQDSIRRVLFRGDLVALALPSDSHSG